jgi:hypothetical protein
MTPLDEEEAYMKCDRCEGLMIEDDFLDMEESFEGMWLRAWRCLNCGRALDPVILANQQRQGDLKPKLRQDEVVPEVLLDPCTPMAA